jgi:hypothetical protein
MRVEALTMMTVELTALLGLEVCSLIDIYQTERRRIPENNSLRSHHSENLKPQAVLYLHGEAASRNALPFLKMDVASFSETLLNVYQVTLCNLHRILKEFQNRRLRGTGREVTAGRRKAQTEEFCNLQSPHVARMTKCIVIRWTEVWIVLNPV